MWEGEELEDAWREREFVAWMLGLLRAEEEGGGGGGAPSIECVKAQKRNNPSQTHSSQVHFLQKMWVRPKRCHHKRNDSPLHLSSCSHHLAPTIGPSRSCLGLLYMGGLLSRRGASVRLASWNVAAVNNNPFEYYTTLADPR